MKVFRAALLILFTVGLAFGQKARPVFHIKRAISLIRIDGVIDEASWGEAEIVDELWQQFPSDTSKAKSQTEFRATYDGYCTAKNRYDLLRTMQ